MTETPATGNRPARTSRRRTRTVRATLFVVSVTAPGAAVLAALVLPDQPSVAAAVAAAALGIACASVCLLTLAPTDCDEFCDLSGVDGEAATTTKYVARRSLRLLAVGGAIFRFLATPIVRFFYRIGTPGSENVPRSGAALLVANHVSYMDPALIQVAVGRPIRFLMHRAFYRKRWLNPIGRLMRVVPIASHDSPRELLRSLRKATECLKQGELVCIFAEGGVTRTGELLPFSRGLEIIVRGTDAPIVPIGLGNIRGTLGSFVDGRMVRELPRPIPHPVTVAFGAPLPADTRADDVRNHVRDLCTRFPDAPDRTPATGLSESPAT
jgi:1-acyl-sn-glycerol-3-phosphate acyltransferase